MIRKNQMRIERKQKETINRLLLLPWISVTKY